MRFELFGVRLQIDYVARIRARRTAPTVSSPDRTKPSEEASQEFWYAFSNSGTIWMTCTCGRTHFPTDTTLDYEAGELESLLAKAAAEPDKYIPDDRNDSIGVLVIDGQMFAWNCPCRKAARYERFIWAERHGILEYLRRRTEAAQQSADEDAAEVFSLADRLEMERRP